MAENETESVIPTGVLYHYCSAQAFLSIVQSRSLWLSSLSMANDTLEGRLLRSLLVEEAKKRQMKASRVTELDQYLAALEETVDGFALCLSTVRDQLSQWRGYADDGRGFAIGFSADYLLKLASTAPSRVDLLPVIYDPESQALAAHKVYEALITPDIDQALEPVSYGSLITGIPTTEEIAALTEDRARRLRPLIATLTARASSIYGLKGPAFEEEREWRLVSVELAQPPKGLHEAMPRQFRSSGAKIVPYKEVKLEVYEIPAVVEIVLGPLNPTPRATVEDLAVRFDFGNVRVANSAASYINR